MSYFDNLQTIANGGGSDQARACRDGQCKICSEELDEDEEEKDDEQERAKNWRIQSGDWEI